MSQLFCFYFRVKAVFWVRLMHNAWNVLLWPLVDSPATCCSRCAQRTPASSYTAAGSVLRHLRLHLARCASSTRWPQSAAVDLRERVEATTMHLWWHRVWPVSNSEWMCFEIEHRFQTRKHWRPSGGPSHWLFPAHVTTARWGSAHAGSGLRRVRRFCVRGCLDVRTLLSLMGAWGHVFIPNLKKKKKKIIWFDV